jgi:ligand-binding SRPBCC domain-containing protein
MTFIELKTYIHAPMQVCFDLSRSIDLHKQSAAHTSEKAIAGRTSGLIENGEFVTWEAIHFGVKQKLTVKIIAMESPTYFCDEMLKGAFKSMKHEHLFSWENEQTVLIDKFFYETPFGIFGKIFDKLILKNYMTRFLIKRNLLIKEVAERGTAI